MVTRLCMKCCGFDNEEFPTEIQKLAKKQLTRKKNEPSNFLYTVLPNVKKGVADAGSKIYTMREKIKQIRKSSKYTQQQVADKLKISKSLYQKIEEGNRKYDLHFIVAFSGIMKTDLSKIIDLNEFITKPHFNFNNE